MESINNLATAAGKMVFGEKSTASSGGGTTNASGTEPPSGQTGKGTVEQPYDAGNAPGMEFNIIYRCKERPYNIGLVR